MKCFDCKVSEKACYQSRWSEKISFRKNCFCWESSERLFLLVGARGLEPPTSCSQSRCYCCKSPKNLLFQYVCPHILSFFVYFGIKPATKTATILNLYFTFGSCSAGSSLSGSRWSFPRRSSLGGDPLPVITSRASSDRLSLVGSLWDLFVGIIPIGFPLVKFPSVSSWCLLPGHTYWYRYHRGSLGLLVSILVGVFGFFFISCSIYFCGQSNIYAITITH
ncbi:hypothetical protein DespoDRAFT_00097 [Desulfobacter postgatei 2ac9]|uniref:Uncharacterized protein n=1 Tax=Desulfobacter postgatei 2ac9 TaxID=879212 RepID=I5AY30_9BACT|nr:hypothetical protein DespoDRAFT_00097 [Desulfobacter postgatei 2ac9]